MGDDVGSRWLGVPAPFVALGFMIVVVVTAVVAFTTGSTASSDDAPPLAMTAETTESQDGDGAPEQTTAPVEPDDAAGDLDGVDGAGTEEEHDPAAETSSDVPAPGATQVQVLDGGGGPVATADVVSALEALGYDIVAVNDARCCYEVTTLLFTSGNQPAAEVLAGVDARFAEVRANPNLSETVHLHVVVGRDWRSET